MINFFKKAGVLTALTVFLSMLAVPVQAQVVALLIEGDSKIRVEENDPDSYVVRLHVQDVSGNSATNTYADAKVRVQLKEGGKGGDPKAKVGEDFQPFNEIISIPVGATHVDVTLPIIHDDDVEKRKKLTLRLDEVGTSSVGLHPNNHGYVNTGVTYVERTIQIYSYELMYFSVDKLYYDVNEGDTATVCLIIWIIDGLSTDTNYNHDYVHRNRQHNLPNGSTGFEFNIIFTALFGTADVNKDYSEFKRKVNVPKGTKHGDRICKSIEIKTDSTPEETESFKVIAERGVGINTYGEFETTHINYVGTEQTAFNINILDGGEAFESANLDIRAAARAGRISVSWDSITNAAKYKVFHRQRPFDCKLGWKNSLDEHREQTRSYDVIGNCPFNEIDRSSTQLSAEFKARGRARGVISPVEIQVIALNSSDEIIASSPVTDMMLDDNDNEGPTQARLTGQVGCQYQTKYDDNGNVISKICLRDLTIERGPNELYLGWPTTPGAGHHNYSQESRNAPYYRVEWKRTDAGAEADWSIAESATLRKEFGNRNHLYHASGNRLGLPVNYTINNLYSGKEYMVRVIALGQVNGPPSRVLRAKPLAGPGEGRFRLVSRTKDFPATKLKCSTDHNCVVEAQSFNVCTTLERSDGNDFITTQEIPLSFEVVGTTPAVEGTDYTWPTMSFPVGTNQDSVEICGRVSADNSNYEVELDETVNFKVSHGFGSNIPSEFSSIDSSRTMQFTIVDNDVVEAKIERVIYEATEGDPLTVAIVYDSANTDVDCLIGFDTYVKIASEPHTAKFKENPENPLPKNAPNYPSDPSELNRDLPIEKVDGYWMFREITMPACTNRVEVPIDNFEDIFVERQTEQFFLSLHTGRINPAGLRVNSRSRVDILDDDEIHLLFADLGEREDPDGIDGTEKFRLAKYTAEEGSTIDIGWTAKHPNIEESAAEFEYTFAVRPRTGSEELVEVFTKGVDRGKHNNVDVTPYVNEGTVPVKVEQVDEDTKAYLFLDGSLLRFQDSIKTFNDQLVEITITDESPYKVSFTSQPYSLPENVSPEVVCMTLVRTDDGSNNFQHPNKVAFIFNTVDGTASATDDYYATTDELVVLRKFRTGNGGSTECRTIFAKDDSVAESDEHLFVHAAFDPDHADNDFSNVTDMETFGTINGATATVTITDDDSSSPQTTGVLTGLEWIDIESGDSSPLTDGLTIQADDGQNYGIVANVDSTVGSVKFALTGPDGLVERTEGLAPWSMWGDTPDGNGNRVPDGNPFLAGNYTLEVIAYSEPNAAGDIIGIMSVDFAVNINLVLMAPRPAISGFTLIDASDQSTITAIAAGQIIDLGSRYDTDIAFRVDTDSEAEIESVVIELSGTKTVSATENVLPWSLYGDHDDGTGTRALDGEPLIGGQYTIAATAYADNGGSGTQLGTLSTSFEIVAEPEITISDADGHEGDDLEFTVSLNRQASVPVDVTYTSVDGTATASEDYTAASGVLTFAVGDTEKTITIATIADNVDEGAETFGIQLSNPVNANISDGEAVGTINNTGIMPGAWLARFARTVTDQVIDVVTNRLNREPQEMVEAQLAGQSVPLMQIEPEDNDHYETQPLTEDDFIQNSSFAFTTKLKSSDMFASVFGQGAITEFSGEDASLNLDGRVTSGFVGFELANDKLTGGLILGHSSGSGDFNDDTYEDGAGNGTIEASLTGVYPYAGIDVTNDLSLWTTIGLGQGNATITRDSNENTVDYDLDMKMAAVGFNQGLLDGLALTGDARYSTISYGISDVNVWSTRIGLEGYRDFIIDDYGTTITPALGIRARYDGGDAETGFGIDLDANLSSSVPRHGLNFDVGAHGLLAHKDDTFKEWGANVAVNWDLTPEKEEGLSVAVSQSWGSSDGNDIKTLLQNGTLPEFNDTTNYFESTVEYGIPLTTTLTSVPNLSLGMADDGSQNIKVGYRLTTEPVNDTSFEINFDVGQTSYDDAESDYEVGVSGTFRF